MSDWQPIETAPKDGRSVLAYQPSGEFPNGWVYPETISLVYWRQGDALNAPYWAGGGLSKVAADALDATAITAEEQAVTRVGDLQYGDQSSTAMDERS